MHVVIRLDLSNILEATARTAEIIDSAGPAIMNTHGWNMRHEIAQRIAQDFSAERGGDTAVDPREVDGAMDTRGADQGDLQHEMTSNAERFNHKLWITERDEKVCPICQPRDGKLFSDAELETMFPAHPRCRCHVETAPIGRAVVDVGTERMSEVLGQMGEEILRAVKDSWTQ